MTPRVFSSGSDIEAALGTDLGVSAWRTVDQPQIDLFADATGDHQWIHTDVARAAEGPYGTTIAHGLLTLALIPSLQKEVYRFEPVRMSLNYGLERVRFITTVPAGGRLRVRCRVDAVRTTDDGGAQISMHNEVELEGATRPALVAVSMTRTYFVES